MAAVGDYLYKRIPHGVKITGEGSRAANDIHLCDSPEQIKICLECPVDPKKCRPVRCPYAGERKKKVNRHA